MQVHFAVVMGHPFVGSTWLTAILDSHPSIVMQQEAKTFEDFSGVNDWFLRCISPYGKHHVNQKCKNATAVGFKVQGPVPTHDWLATNQASLLQQNTKIICIDRANAISQFVSSKHKEKIKTECYRGSHIGMHAEWTRPGASISCKAAAQNFTVDISGEELAGAVQAYYKRIFWLWEQCGKYRDAGGQVFTLIYEDLIERREETVQAIHKFLAVPSGDSSSRLTVKATSASLRSIITNFDDIERQLSNDTEMDKLIKTSELQDMLIDRRWSLTAAMGTRASACI